MSCCPVLDLRLTPPGITVPSYAYSVLRESRPGELLWMWSPDEPALLMAQLQTHLRHTLVWSATPDGHGFLIKLHVRGPDEPLSLTDTLRRDHDTLDKQLVAALSFVAARCWDEAVLAVAYVDRGLRAHILLENDTLSALASEKEVEPTAIMRREHNDILAQLDILADVCGSSAEQCRELDTWLSLIAATLNKHEFREETLLFPAWERALRHRPDAASLLAETRHALHGGNSSNAAQAM